MKTTPEKVAHSQGGSVQKYIAAACLQPSLFEHVRCISFVLAPSLGGHRRQADILVVNAGGRG